MFETLQTMIAIVPLTAYLLFLGAINWRRRPTMISGPTEKALLALALAGFIFVGPVQLFMPEEAATALGVWVWAPMTTLYVLVIALWILSGRERLVIYNLSRAQLEPALMDVAKALSAELESTADLRRLPTLGVQFVIDEFAWMRCVSLVAMGREDTAGWNRFSAAMRARLAAERTGRNPRALSFVSIAAALLIVVWMRIPNDRLALRRGLYDLLRLDDHQPNGKQ